MIKRLVITDFAVARSVTIEPGPGLNVFTGETGAGKSLAVDALAFALGARRGREVVATGADRATVEVTLGLAGREQLIERSIGLSGRSTLRVGGEVASLAEVEELTAGLVDIHGQSEQLSILRPAVQLRVLDEFAGLSATRDELAAGVRELRDLRRRIAALATDSRERERLVEQLAYESNEIDSAALQPGEDETLRADHSRLSNATRLLEDAARALDALDSGPLGEVTAALGDLVERDSSATEVADLLALFETASADLVRALRHYRENVESDPEALARVEERLDLIARLRRKYGDSVDEILAYARDARARLASLTGAEGSLDALRETESRLVGDLASRALSLSAARRQSASRLAATITAELEALGMGGAALAVGFGCDDAPDGLPVPLPDYEVIPTEAPSTTPGEAVPRSFAETGVDRVEFLASFNPGESPRPLAAVASGGETSRFLLALATVLGSAAEPRIIVFDEVDEGVGGRAGALVGSALARLARRHQVLCITHLPQVAAFGDTHFTVAKHTDGARTWTELATVDGEDRVAELAAMLGGPTEANLTVARDLLTAHAPSR